MKKLILLCLGLFLFILFFHKGIETEDVWLHLSTGHWITGHSQVPHEDVFPFADEKTPYLCHEWLASSILYLVYKTGGFTGLKLLRSIFFLLTIGTFLVYSYRRINFSFLILLILLMSYGLFQRSLLRPDTCNLLFIQIFLISLFSYEKTGGLWKLIILPLIGILWINIHMMGAFLYGGSIIFIFLLTAIIRYFNLKDGQYVPSALRDPKRQVKELILTLFVFQITFVINPYDTEGLVFPYKVLLFPHYYGFYQMMTIMRELQNSLYIFFSLDYFYFILLIIFPIILLFSNKKGDLTLIFLYTLALIAFLYMTRNSGFFTVIAGYAIVLGAQNIGLAEKWSKLRWSGTLDALILTGVTLVMLIQSFNLSKETVYFNNKIHRAMFVDTNPYVVSSINLLKDNGIAGPVFNSSILGGSILWFDYPQLRPIDDGRHLDYKRFDDTINVLLDPPKYWDQVEGTYGIKIVVLSQGNTVERKVLKYLSTLKDWQLIGIEGPFVIYVKRGEFYLTDTLDKFEQRLRSIDLTDNDIKQLTSLSQRQQRSALLRFFQPSPFRVDTFSDGVTLMGLGYKGAAAKDFIEALKVSDQPYMQEIVSVFLNN